MASTRRRFLTSSVVALGSAAGIDLNSALPARADTDCQQPTPDQLVPSLSAASAAAGDQLTVTAAFGVIGQGGVAVQPNVDTVELWWDLDPDQWWTATIGEPASINGGQAQRLAAVSTSGECGFSLDFVVPEAASGAHPVVPIAYTPTGNMSYYASYLTVA